MSGTRTSLVTGGAGFIGSHVARACLERGDEVIVLDDLSGGQQLTPDGCREERSCLLDADFWRHELPTGITHVYHLAAYAAEVASIERRVYTYETNVVGSAEMVAWARKVGVENFTFVSSVAAQTTNDPYGISKLAAELDLRTSGLPYNIVRLHNVYGPGQRMNDPERNVVARFIGQCFKGEPMTVYGEGEQTRAFTYVGDIIEDIVGGKGDGGLYGNHEQVRIIDLAHAVAEAVGCECKIEHMPERKERFSCPTTRRHREWTSLEDGLAKTVEALCETS